MGGIAPPKPPRYYNILSVAAAPVTAEPLKGDSANITKSGFAIKPDENLFASGAKTNESCWNENTSELNSSYRLARGCSRLMYACQHGLTETVVRELRTKPERIRQRDSSNKSVLHYCSGQRDLVAAASVAVAAPDLLESADEDGFTPLHLAVIQGNLAMVNLLLANKADVNAVDNEGHSVVHWATVCGEMEALRSVLQAGADVKTPDINGGSPLHYAAQMCGANYESKLGQATSSKLALEILDILLSHPLSSVDITDKDGRKPLLWAASAGSAKAVLALVKAGSRVESSDKDGLTALHCAASRGHTECIDTLISLCGAPTDLIDSNGCTALHYAVTLGHADATSRLLDLDADPNRQDRKGRTPAHCGCSKGQVETVKLLKEWGANLWLRNAKGDLPLHEAASSGRRELVEWFLEQKPKQVNTTSNDGRSLLHISASNDYTDICKLLLDYGANVNSILRNSKGIAITPLDCALQKGYRSTAKFLQSNGGLPASKLRLSARRISAFNEQVLVKPLKYAERTEIYNLKNSKKCVMYSKRSDSDSDDQCSCNEHTYKKEHTYSHTCRQHRKRSRRRTSSCGEMKNICREDSCSDICRSKSNIEIRRKKSRERASTSESELDSCENCCYHKKKHKQKRRERTTRKLSVTQDFNQDSDINKETVRKRPEEDKNPIKDAKSTAQQPEDAVSRPSSKTSSKSHPQSQQVKSENNVDNMSSNLPLAMSMTDEEGESPEGAEQVVVTKADIHVAPDAVAADTVTATDLELEPNQQVPEADKTNAISEENIEVISKEINQVLENAATAVTSVVGDSPVIENDSSTANNVAIESKQQESDSVQQFQDNFPVQETLELTGDDVSDLRQGEGKEGKTEASGDPAEENNSEEIFSEVSQKSAPGYEGKDIEVKPLVKEAETPQLEREEDNAAITSESKVENELLNKVISTPSQTTELEEVTPSADQQPLATTETVQLTHPTIPKKSAPPPSNEESQNIRDQESRRSFTLLPDSPDDLEAQSRKSSFQVLKSDESVDVDDVVEQLRKSDVKTFQIVDDDEVKSDLNAELSSDGEVDDEENIDDNSTGMYVSHSASAAGFHEYNGRKRRVKKRIKSGGIRGRSYMKMATRVENGQAALQHSNKDQDSGFEPSPRTVKTKIPTPRNTYTAHVPRKAIYATLDGRFCSSRLENRKPGDKGACDMSAVTRSIQRNIRRYYMERKIFQHLLELKSLQIRSNKLNEAVLVKRAVDEYHKSCIALGGETGTTLRRYSYSEYTFKNFELFLYETLKTLQRPGTFNFQNINDVYEEAERRLSPDYNAYEKALQCTTKTHRCLHAAHAYTGIPCAAYIPMMNHHTMPKFGFGPYKKSGAGSFYLPKILSRNPSCGSKVSLELSHGKNKQLISLPSEKLDSNKRYYVTFTVKESSGKQQLQQQAQTTTHGDDSVGDVEKSCDQKKPKQDRDDK